MKHLLISLLSLVFTANVLWSQTDTILYFESYFETLMDRQQWSSVPADINIKWTFQEGGNELNPDTAYRGEYNAFYYWSAFDAEVRQMVSIPIDLSDSKKPELTFAHAMYQSVFGTDRLAVLFKAGTSAPWDTVAVFSAPVNPWTLRTFNIKDFGTKYLCQNFQIAFKGTARAGHGICIDNVVIEEKDVILRYVKSTKVKGIIQDPLPAGASDIPILRMDVNVVGNTDPLLLNSMVFTSLSSHDSLFAPNGFELVVTKDSSYRPTLKGVSLKIGSSASISGGLVTFSTLNYSLSTGYNAIWLIADVKHTAPHKSIADFKLGAGSINIGGNTFPAMEVSPPGQNVIEEAVFYDSFEGASIWTLQNDFEVDLPKGFTTYITEDPDFAYTGTKILGTDLITDGQYRVNVNFPAPNGLSYYATTPLINLQYYNDVKLSFRKWISFEGNDHGVIEVSNDNGTTWQKIWDSKIDALTPDNDWVNCNITEAFNEIAAHKPAVKVRFGIIYSDNNFAYGGFNIDNFAITGNYLTNDVGILEIGKPVNDCHNPGMDSVMIVVHNYADRATASSIPVFFSIDGSPGNRVVENIPGPIPSDGTLTYTFAHPAEFPSPGDYSSFTIKLQASGDEDPENDEAVKPVFIQKSVSPPDLENFETGGGFWKRYGTDPRWLCKVPEGSIPPASGNSWISSPFGNYLTNDTAYLESSCYDLFSTRQLIFEMQLWIDSEPGKDGAVIDYSTDDGLTWSPVPKHGYPWNWNWYNGEVTSLGTQGWSGINTQNWKTVKQLLPEALLDEPKVKFRVRWASDGDNTYRGTAIDNVKIYPAPPDIGILQIDSFANRCQNINPDEVTVTIKNMGINTIQQQDSIIVGLDLNHIHVATDTFLLAADLLPGATVKYTFEQPVDVIMPGNYNLTAYTLIEDDPWFYEVNNDSVSLDFIVYPGPLTSLIDTIQTHLPDTVVLETIYNADYDYWWNGMPGSNTYDVADDGWQYLTVTATRGNGCTSWDSANVELLFYDVGTAALIHPVNDCGLGKHDYPVVRVKNFGTDSISAGQKIAVCYTMNSGSPVSDTLLLTHSLYSGKWTDFTFTKGDQDLSEQGIYDFKIYTSYGGDTIAVNDTIISSIEILGRPVINLGPDMTVEALSHTLDAGTGYESYEWDNGVTSQTREVTESGSYWVRVLDENQCDNYDTAFIWLKIRDINPVEFESPLSDCTFDNDVPVSFRILNSGTDTLPSGSSIAITYRFLESERVSDNITLGQPLMPGASFVYTFTENVNLGSTGDFSLEATAVISGDLRTENDSLRTTIYRYPKPVVDFGLENTEYIEDISLQLEAGYSPFYSYQWQDTTTTHFYTVTSDGLYHVKATDTRTQCFDRDSVRVFLIYGDIGVTWSDMPSSGCTGTSNKVRVKVTNLGPSAIGGSAPIYIACDVNGERLTFDTLTRVGNFNPGAVLELEFSESIPVEGEGISRVDFYTLYDKDKKPENDTLSLSFSSLQVPVIDFGDINGDMQVELPYLLNAGDGHKLYLWQDNSTDQTFQVNEKGTYSVTVTGQNDCQSSKTVRINIQVSAAGNIEEMGSINIYPNPGNGLFHISVDDGSDDLLVRIFNNNGQMLYMREFRSHQLSQEMIDVQHLPRGIYHLVITSDTKNYQGNIVIQ